MTSRRWRLSVYLFVTLLSLSLLIKSRTIPTRKSAAFLRYTTGAVILKVTGSNGQDGIYRIIDGENSKNAKNMTLQNVSYLLKKDISVSRRLESGDVLAVSGKYLQVYAKKMTATEMILLGIPLNSMQMSVSDWDSLPGIGTVLAEEIERYCQNNGEIVSVEALVVIPGMGEAKIKRIKPFFR